MSSVPPPADWRSQRRLLRERARAERQRARSLRRQSVVGPLFLLGIGVVFLLVETGRISQAAAISNFTRFWPVLLILAGVLRLGEWALDLRERREANAAGYTYSTRTLGWMGGLSLILLLALGISAALVRQNRASLFGGGFTLDQNDLNRFFGNKHESDHTDTHPCPDGTVFTIQNPRGDVTITGDSTDGLAHLSVHQEVYSSSDDVAAQRASQLTPRWEQSGNSLTLLITSVEGGRSDLVLSVPAATAIEATANRGDLHLHSLHSSVSATANHGGLEFSSITGPVSAHGNNAGSSISGHNVSGPVSIEGHAMDVTLSDLTGPMLLKGEFFGTVHLERTTGPVQVHTSRVDLQFVRLDGELELSEDSDLTADQVSGPFVLNTRNRNITLDQITGPVAINNRNGSVALIATSPIGPITVENRNGPIDLTLPDQSGFEIQAETTNGDLSDAFELTPVEEGNRSHLSGSVGQGGPSIRLTTSQADITVRKGDRGKHRSEPPAAPAPPSPPLSRHPSGQRASGTTQIE